MKLTEITLFYNTPFTDFQNTIHFSSNKERDDFFTNSPYYNVSKMVNKFNFVKDRLELKAPITTAATYGLNYMRFRNDYDNDKWYYCYVINTEYVNDNVTKLYLVIDCVMTFLQGNFWEYIHNASITRQHVPLSEFDNYKNLYAGNNDDINTQLLVASKKFYDPGKFYVVFQSSVSLKSDFGTENNPKLHTGQGNIHDEITSPVNIYVVKSIDNFQKVISKLSDYPWIAQNINSIAIVPAFMVDEKDLHQVEDIKLSELNDLKMLYTFNSGSHTADNKPKELMFNYDDLMKQLGLVTKNKFLLKNCKIYITDWNGQNQEIDPFLLPNYAMTVIIRSVVGYENMAKIFVDGYKMNASEPGLLQKGHYSGTYLNDSITLNQFDGIPVLVDNYKLAKAQTAHTRELNNSRTISGRIGQITSNQTSLKDKFFNAVSLLSSATSVSGAAGMFNNEYEYYRTQNAQFKDMQLTPPSVSDAPQSESFLRSKNEYGISIIFMTPPEIEQHQLLAYYGKFGVAFNGFMGQPFPFLEPYMNYLQCKISTVFPNVPAQCMKVLAAQLENGVFFYKHVTNKGKEFEYYPFNSVNFEENYN